MWINVFLVIESLFYVAISRPCHLSEFCPNRAWSAIILAAQAPSALVASAHSVHVLTTAFPSSHLLCLAFGLCINFAPTPPPFYFSSDKSVSRVVVSVGVGVMHQSIPPAPSSPPGYCGAFARLVIPGGGAFANFALPGGQAFANPRAIPELLTRTQFPIRI